MSARGAYYNDNDAFAVGWLRRLIAAGHLPGGDVDDRSIEDVQPDDLRGYDAVHLFAGIGGWPYALDLAGWPADRPVWSCSCPCPPFSVAGRARACPECSSTALVWHPGWTGVACCAACHHEWVEDARHLWPEALRLIAECRPPVVFGEQVAGVGGLDWFAGVRGSLELGGYAVGAFVAPAAGVGAPHRRERLFWLADPEGIDGWRRPQQHNGRQSGGDSAARELADAAGEPGQFGLARGGPADEARELADAGRGATERHAASAGAWGDFDVVTFVTGEVRRVEPGTFPVAHGAPHRMGRLRGYGNAVVPQLAAEFVSAYLQDDETRKARPCLDSS